LRISSYFVAQHNRLGNFLHRFALLAALALERQVGLLFVQSQIALQNAFGAFHDLASLELFGESYVCFLQPCQLNFRSDEKSYGGNHANFATPVNVMLAVLQVDDTDHSSPAHQRHGKKCFITVFGQFVEKLKAGILRRLFGDGNGLAMFRHPSRNALPHAQFQAVDNFFVRVFGGAQNQLVAFENINQAGIALHQRSGKFNNAVQYIVKSIRRTEANTDFVEYIYM